MCGDNSAEINELQLLAGVNRLGLDNPTPVITRRLACFGNEADATSLLKEAGAVAESEAQKDGEPVTKTVIEQR